MIGEPRLLLREANALQRGGDLLAAYDLLHGARLQGEHETRRRQLLATVLCELSDPQQALALLEPLPPGDPETVGGRARALKDIALAHTDGAKRTAALARAIQAYEEGFGQTAAYWHAINAATLRLLVGDVSGSRRLATQVRSLCQTPEEDDYWRLATLGEAELLLGQTENAVVMYAMAFARGHGRWRELKSTRRNALMILAHQEPKTLAPLAGPLAVALRIPCVGVCVGHRVDAQDRPAPRLPQHRIEAVAEQLAKWIRQRGVGFGVSGAAAGTDLLFARGILDNERELDLFIPYPEAEFRQDSVEYAGEPWSGLYETVLNSAHRLAFGSRHRFKLGSASFEYGNAYLEGQARLRAQRLGTDVARVAVWDGRPGDGPGGTAAMVQRWIQAGVAFDVIDPAAPELGACPSANSLPIAAPPQSEDDSTTLAVLFADAVGFSGLGEEQIDVFVRRFLGAVAEVAQEWSEGLRVRETWGDGLHFVFDRVATAGGFALALQQRITSTDWEEHGLPAQLGLRIGLHAGPASFVRDPVTGTRKAFGTHISHAARIEPVTPPGHVYASESFAALAAADGVSEFTCTYVGVIQWAKKYGAEATYRLLPQPSAENH